MLRLMGSLTDLSDWNEKIHEDGFVDAWKAEKLDEEGVTEAMVNWVGAVPWTAMTRKTDMSSVHRRSSRLCETSPGIFCPCIGKRYLEIRHFGAGRSAARYP